LGTNVVWETPVDMARTVADTRSALAISAQTKIFISLVIVLGWIELAYGLLQWRSDPAGFLVYLAVVCLLSGW